MSRTYRKHPRGVDLHPHPTRDGISWYFTPITNRHIKKSTNKLARREWLSNRELLKERARENLAWC